MSNPALAADIATRHWAMLPSALAALHAYATADTKPTAFFIEPDEPDRPDIYAAVIDGVAVIAIEGTILKSRADADFYQEWGIPAVAVSAITDALTAAADDPAVDSILLAIDSPGGEVAGTQELADAIYAVRTESKPVHAAIEDLGASGAYWLASQADTISANLTGIVGSIGVYTWIDDVSKLFDEMGIKTHLIASGPYKGAGFPGPPVTDEHIKPIREEIDGLAAIFASAVARGRGRDAATVATWATGRCWLAQNALAMGLIDHVENGDATLRRVTSGDANIPTPTAHGKELPMSIIAKIKALVANAPDDDAPPPAIPVAAEPPAAEPPPAAVEHVATITSGELTQRAELLGADQALATIALPLPDAIAADHTRLKAVVAGQAAKLDEQAQAHASEIADLKAAHAAALKAIGAHGEPQPASHDEPDPTATAVANFRKAGLGEAEAARAAQLEAQAAARSVKK